MRSDRQVAVRRAIDARILRLRESDPTIEIRVLPNIPKAEGIRVVNGSCTWDNCGQSVAILYNATDNTPKLRCTFHSRGLGRRRARAARDEQTAATRCPRPDKYAWGTFEGAELHLKVMRNRRPSTTAQLRVYECRCGYYHIGNE